MSKLRSINTLFWSDTYVENLSANEKLLFLYLLTNTNTNLLGIYEISIKKMQYDTGLEINIINEILDKFKKNKKIFYFQNYIFLKNFSKNQKYNPSMISNAYEILLNIPIDVFSHFFNTGCTQGVDTMFKNKTGYLNFKQSVTLKIKNEDEDEDKDERKNFIPKSIFTLEEIKHGVNNLDWITWDEKTQLSYLDEISKEFKTMSIWYDKISMDKKILLPETHKYFSEFFKDLKLKEDINKGITGIKSHFVNWLNKKLNNAK